MIASLLLLGCLTCGGDPDMDLGDLQRQAMPFSLRGMPPRALAPEPAAPAFFDLSWPGALERLERENPAHARKAQEILRAAGPLPCEALLERFRARTDLADPTCVTRTLLASDPPRRIVGFTLEGRKYLAWVSVQ